MKKNVAVVCGGYTAEREISLGSGDVVIRNLDESPFNVFKVVIDPDGWFVEPEHIPVDMADFSFLWTGNVVKFDLVFNAIHGSPGEDGKLQGYLDMMGVPYTNCGVATSALTFNKFWTKQVLDNHQIPMAKGRLVNKQNAEAMEQEISSQFQLPLFVKPNNNGSSFGVSKVKDMRELSKAISEALKYDREALVEEGISGREVTCGVYRHEGNIKVLPICEVVTGKHDFFDYTAKYTAGESDEIIPAPIPETEAIRVRNYSTAIYEALNCRGVVRIDYIIANGVPHFLEVNTVPGLSEASIVPKMAKTAGMTLNEFFTGLLDGASCDH
ncbi:MAG TPA: D-alanine--D-alanine ligase [Chitinophagales bacterium]|nr:D-alanine--D-alanine ligase [Chitinophagales bacterium]HNI54268.1 D-alanine--D-alanine ligase [Chitinophagales bacterium]HNJ89121.1 D-alanine--D-alanine ligase [Chitinophagales bacterium]